MNIYVSCYSDLIYEMFKVRYSTCVIHEAVYVSEDLKTTSCRNCNLRPKGSVKTKACSSTRLLIWVHIWEAGSQALTAAPPWGLDLWVCCHWTDWRESAQTRSGCDIKFKIRTQHQSQCLPRGNVLKISAGLSFSPVYTASGNATALFICL